MEGRENKQLGLSPVGQSKRQADQLDNDKDVLKAKENTSSQKCKRPRLEVKTDILQSTAKETHIGGTDATNNGFNNGNLEVTEIPPPTEIPKTTPLTDYNHPEVVFDLESTGFGWRSHITQLAAVGPNGTFVRYIIPKVPIGLEATMITGIRCLDGQMYHKMEPMEGVPVKQGIQEFIQFLGDQPVILIGHNVKRFDCPVLWNAAKACGMDIELEKAVAGFLDTLVLFRDEFKHLKEQIGSFKQEKLHTYFLGQENYEAHNALPDVVALQAILKSACPSNKIKLKYTFRVNYILQSLKCNGNKNKYACEWEQLIAAGSIKRPMAENAAASGLCPSHLELAYKRNGAAGIKAVLSEKNSEGKPRVTKSRKIITEIITFYSHNQ